MEPGNFQSNYNAVSPRMVTVGGHASNFEGVYQLNTKINARFLTYFTLQYLTIPTLP